MKKLVCTLLCFAGIVYGFAEDRLGVSTFMNASDVEKVLKGEILTRMYLKYDADGENTDQMIKVPVTQYSGVDSYDDYEMVTDEKAFIPYELTPENKIKFYNLITAPSKLNGMKYYSRKARKVLQLIVDCYQLDDKNKKVSDTVFTSIKKHITANFRQKDNKFGTLDFKSEVFNSGDDFVLHTTCLGSIPLVCKPGEYQIVSYFIYDENRKGFFYYSVYVMRVRTEMLLKKGGLMTLHPTTFSNRLRAATVHLAGLLGLDWSTLYNPWSEKKLKKGGYKNY